MDERIQDIKQRIKAEKENKKRLKEEHGEDLLVVRMNIRSLKKELMWAEYDRDRL